MLDLHVITTAKAKKAMRGPLGLRMTYFANGCVSSVSPFFCQYLLKYMLNMPALGKTEEERRHAIYGGGLTVQSTIDLRFQRAADRSVRAHVYPQDHAIGALAMVEPGTGYVKALAQSRPMGPKKHRGQTFLNFTVPKMYGDSNGFQAGSTFKVFVLSQAIKQGIPLNKTINSPAAVTVDLGSYKTCGGYYQSSQSFTFHNSTESGVMDLYTGTQLSVNTFFIQLEQMTGLCGPWKLAQQMGIQLTDPGHNRVPSFTLGIVDVSPLEMAEAYATFANRGVHCASTPVLEIRDRQNQVIPTPGPQCNRVLKPAYADAVNDILKGVMAPGGFGEALALNQDSAGKTGTVAPAKSVWFVGYTPSLATASMIAGVKSNGDGADIDFTVIGGVNVGSAHGSTTAGPMWGDAMKAIQQWLPDRSFVSPDPGVVNGQSVPIPSFYGYQPDVAAQKLSVLGFNPQISYSVDSSAPKGTVAYTSPSYEGTTGETVSIYISNGYTPPPTTQPPTTQPPTTQPPTSPPGGGGGNPPGDGGNGHPPGNGGGH